MKPIKKYSVVLAVLSLGLTLDLLPAYATSFGTAFSYQGRLASSGTNAANGLYDFQFSLWDDVSSGRSVSPTQSVSAVSISNGLFSTALDFGAGVFDGSVRWLQIAVRTNGTGTFTLLTPRQNLTPVPYSLVSSNLVGNLSASQLSGVIPGSAMSGTYPGAVTFSSPLNFFSGDGSGLTHINATQFGGLGINRFWQLAGNGGTIAGADFLGTTDNQALELKVNLQRALRLEPRTGSSPNLIGGYGGNYVGANAVGVTISGGGDLNFANQVPDSLTYGPSSYATIGGGLANVIPAATYGTISGGYSNRLGVDGINGSAAYSSIGGGSNNRIEDSQWATIAGGARNYMTGLGYSDYCSIGGGLANYALQGTYGTISGGVSNYIYNFSTVIGGGNGNTNWARQATIGGGFQNFIYGDDFGASAVSASIGGGERNNIGVVSLHSTIAGGFSNRLDTARGATIGGGRRNLVNPSSDDTTIAGGSLNTIGVNCDAATISGGLSNIAGVALATIPGGAQANASHFGQMAYASGQFATPGDAQTSTYVCRGVTTNATLTELFLDGASARLTMPANSTWGIDALITGRTATGVAAVFQVIGAAKNNAGVSSLIGTTYNAFTRKDDATWTADVIAGSGGAIVVQVKGAASGVVRWVANMRTVEVVY